MTRPIASPGSVSPPVAPTAPAAPQPGAVPQAGLPSQSGPPEISAARLRLEATRVALAESDLPADLKQKVTANIVQARTDLEAIASRRTATPTTPDAVLKRLAADVDVALKDRAALFSEHIRRVAEESSAFSRRDTGGMKNIMELLLHLTFEQQKLINSILSEASLRIGDVRNLSDAQREARLRDIGFATRSAVRATFTPDQLRQWDDLLARPRPGETTPTSQPVAEIQAEHFFKFEVMRIAAREGPYTPRQKATALARIDKAQADIIAVATAPIQPNQPTAIKRIDALELTMSREFVEILGGEIDDFERRRSKIASQLISLHNAELPLDHTWVEELRLTPEQQSKIDKILVDRVKTLQDTEKAAGGYAPAVKRMKRDQVAIVARDAINQVLSPSQRKTLNDPQSR